MSEKPCTTYHFPSAAHASELIGHLLNRAAAGGEDTAKTEAAVRAILGDVKERGLDAVIDYTRKFDCPDFTPGMFAVHPQTVKEAASAIPGSDRMIIREAATRIRKFHEAQKSKSWFMSDTYGSILGQAVTPLDRVGLYVPGGKGGETPLISSLLMNAVPAQVAGVNEIAVVSPPGADGTVSPYILAAAHELGISEIYACGSAWAVAALAYGADSLVPVDLIAGPGNIWVTTAKKLLLGTVGIDMLAGPSEICVIADETARPAWVAADMLSQAEHDPLACSVCITTSPEFAGAVQAELEAQLRTLPREAVARASLASWGAVIVTPDLATAAAIANKIAPEHLELCVAEPWALAPFIRHAGAVFIGHYAAEPVGDYFAGPNHVLPTMGTARFSSALSVETFCKKSSMISVNDSFTRAHAASIARLARLEGLEAHARSVEARLDGK
ncbi:histidinol dehydrogenase [Desulfovibrio sp. OttesenSCG-928-O18]|nr:histidinol dehydrogenase [Desulfovibrio sp. OttesenSCG-928-O18]